MFLPICTETMESQWVDGYFKADRYLVYLVARYKQQLQSKSQVHFQVLEKKLGKPRKLAITSAF